METKVKYKFGETPVGIIEDRLKAASVDGNAGYVYTDVEGLGEFGDDSCLSVGEVLTVLGALYDACPDNGFGGKRGGNATANLRIDILAALGIDES